MDRLVAQGGEALPSPADVARDVDVLILSLPSERAFEQVACDPDGVAARAHDGLAVVETSTLPIAVKDRGRLALALKKSDDHERRGRGTYVHPSDPLLHQQ